MLYTHRPAKAADFIQASEQLAPWYRLPKEDLATAWTGILSREGVWSLVIEEAESPHRPVSLSLSVFVSDRLADRMELGKYPHVGSAIVSRFLTKGDEPLPLERIRAAHWGDGLNLVSMHTLGLDVPIGGASTGLIGEMRARVCGEALQGYNLRRCLREVYSPQALASFQSGGWRIRTDYSEFYGTPADAPSLDRPFLMGINRTEAEDAHFGGARMASMFHRYPIRLSLRRVHRELLASALEGLTDAELSARLSLSPSAIKKRWASVYEHVEGLIPGLPPLSDRNDKTRGAERRRHVLNYLREHPEEFRPLSD
ncbi:hypothetical protein EON82_01370 [bacterium]|nr:MAG: hypothetical protein EON82_01370 [bacterium]